jgi:hypothetical protein
MSNPDPSPSTRFQPGASGNPQGSSRRARLTAALHRVLDAGGNEDAFALAGLTQALAGEFPFWREILNRTDGIVQSAAELAALQAREQIHEAREQAREKEADLATEHIREVLETLCCEVDTLPEKDLRRLANGLADLTRSGSLVDLLKQELGLSKRPEVTEDDVRRLWSELALPAGMLRDPDPSPLPRGFRELPAPRPNPDREALQARAVDLERARRERLKDPRQAPPPPAASEAEPAGPGLTAVQFSDLVVFPGFEGM